MKRGRAQGFACRPCGGLARWRSSSSSNVRAERGIVLFVVIAVLALLSLLAATFAMLMSVELAASRCLTEHEVARQAAHAGANYVVQTLEATFAATGGNSPPSRPLPDFCADPADPFGCQLLYRRDGLKVYFAVHAHSAPGARAPDWMAGLGCDDSGMFDINAMGFAGDLGSPYNPDIRYTSFDCSLVRLLASRFAAMGPNELALVDAARMSAYPTFGNPEEQQRVAILLSHEIVDWRHGPDGVPGSAGTEEKRLGHLPRWSSLLGSANVNAGIGYPSSGDDKFNWGWSGAAPARYVNPFQALAPYLPDLGRPWSHAQPGVWTAYLGGANWGNDIGVPLPGLFYGKMAAGSGLNTIVADTSQPGWRDWRANPPVWTGCWVYVATGPCKGAWRPILSNNEGSLSVRDLGANPLPGDAFCIHALGATAGRLSKRWDAETPVCGDLVPNAMLWPDGTLATEGNVLDLVLDSGALTGKLEADTDAYLDDAGKRWPPDQWRGATAHVYAGAGRGQVRTITGNSDNRLLLAAPWTLGNHPDTTSRYRIELPDDNLPSKFRPNNLQGDDRLYRSLGELRDSVVVPALMRDGLPGPAARATADIFLRSFAGYLCASAHGPAPERQLAAINDWAVDGICHDAECLAGGIKTDVLPDGGRRSEAAEREQILRRAPATSLYRKLGLKDWAHADADSQVVAKRVKQAAQLVANIMDFRGEDDAPTKLTDQDIGEDPTTSFAVYGAKGIHATQVMLTPGLISSDDGSEMTDDGGGGTGSFLTGGQGWAWFPDDADFPGKAVNLARTWIAKVKGDAIPAASFTFTGLKPGFYAMRLRATRADLYPRSLSAWNDSELFILTCNKVAYYAKMGGNFARKYSDGNGPLACFEIKADGKLTFQLAARRKPKAPLPPDPDPDDPDEPTEPDAAQRTNQAWITAVFGGFTLLPQYVQITNIAAHDVRLDGWTLDMDEPWVKAGWGQWTASQSPSPPAPVTPPIHLIRVFPHYVWGILKQVPPSAPYPDLKPKPGPIPLPDTYFRLADGKTVDVRRIPGAAATGTFPIKYGTYVVCMCEEAFERQWSARRGDPDYNPRTNGDGLWGNEANENCVLYPAGDVSDIYAMDLFCGLGGGAGMAQRDPTSLATLDALFGIGRDPVGWWYDQGWNTRWPEFTVHDLRVQDNWLEDPWEATAVEYPWVTFRDRANHLAAGGPVDGMILPPGAYDPQQGYSCLEKATILQPTWNRADCCWAAYDSAPEALTASQNRLILLQSDSPRSTIAPTLVRSSLNKNWAELWDAAKGYPTLAKPSDLFAQNRVLPIILNRPYPTAGWLGLVPTSNAPWRTVDPNPAPGSVPDAPEKLLGTLMANAAVGGAYSRFNINTAPVDILKTVFPDAQAALIVARRDARRKGFSPPRPWPGGPDAPPALADKAWANWDELLNDPIFQLARNDGTAIGYLDDIANGISNADAGAGTYADDFPDNSDEREEWFRRFSNLFDLKSTSFRFVVAGLAYKDRPWDPDARENNRPIAVVRLEAFVDLTAGAPAIVHLRYPVED